MNFVGDSPKKQHAESKWALWDTGVIMGEKIHRFITQTLAAGVSIVGTWFYIFERKTTKLIEKAFRGKRNS